MSRRARYLLCAIITGLSLIACGCGARGDLYLPTKNQEQKP